MQNGDDSLLYIHMKINDKFFFPVCLIGPAPFLPAR